MIKKLFSKLYDKLEKGKADGGDLKSLMTELEEVAQNKIKVEKWDYYKLLAKKAKDDRKTTSLITTEVIINTNIEVMPLIHFFLSEISEIGIKNVHRTMPTDDWIKRDSDLKTIVQQNNKLLELIDDNTKMYKVVEKALEKA